VIFEVKSFQNETLTACRTHGLPRSRIFHLQYLFISLRVSNPSIDAVPVFFSFILRASQ